MTRAPVRWKALQSVFVVDDLQFETADRRRPEIFARSPIAAVFVVKTLQIGLAAHPLDGADEQALQPRIILGGIREAVGLFGWRHGRWRIAVSKALLKPSF